LVELCEEKLPTYFINNEEKIISDKEIRHFNFHFRQEKATTNYLPIKRPLKILITSGASCPDALVEAVIKKLASFFPTNKTMEDLIEEFSENETSS
jgi:4-hydroxy-3-methylbut-2-enyl diphosphate reductase